MQDFVCHIVREVFRFTYLEYIFEISKFRQAFDSLSETYIQLQLFRTESAEMTTLDYSGDPVSN